MKYSIELRHFFIRSMLSGCMSVDLQKKIQLCLAIDRCMDYFEQMGFVGVEFTDGDLALRYKIIKIHQILLIL